MSEEQNQTQTQEEAKPVYKMGAGIPSVDDYREAESHGFKSESEETQQTETQQTETQTVNNENATTSDNTQLEENAASFSMPNYEEQGGDGQTTEAGANQANATIADWKNELKKANPKEILKELGYDDFVAEFAEFRKNGGDAYKYLEAKAFDWTSVSHEDLIMDDLKLQYPHLSDDKIERLYQAKYKQNDYASDDDKEVGLIQLEADAELVRQKRINEQSSFQIPEIAKTQEAVDMQAMYEEQRKFEAEQAQKVLQFFQEHEATKNLYQSKRVAIDLGDNGKFNFNIDKPENLMSVALDSEKWQRAISINPQEADPNKLIPDVAKLQKIALVAMNPNYEKDLVNYGKSLGLKAIVEEGQNARRPIGNTPAQPNESFAEAIKTRAKVSTLGR
jgi:hypothetical protein